MKTREHLGRRKASLSLLCALFLLCCGLPQGAGAATGIRALDEPAMMVTAPDKVSLIAIALAGNRLVAVGEHGVIAYSDDNGLTWHQSVVPVTLTLTCVAFSSPTNGWAAGHYGVILHTADGGKTWQLQMTGIGANQLTLDAANRAIAQDATNTDAKRALRRANIFMAAGPDKPFLSILTQSGTAATIFGAYRMTLKTNDGGKTWADWSLHIGDKLSHNLYDVFSAGPALYVVGETGLVFRSVDGGNNFPEVTQPGDATLLGGIDLRNDGVLVFGVAGQAFRSADGGTTWQSVSFGATSSLVVAHALRSGGLMIASEDGGLYTSADDGMTFLRLPENVPMALYDFVQAADGSIVVVGNRGVMRLAAPNVIQP